MANFSNDSNLLAYEPRLFIDVPLRGQELLRITDGLLVGSTLTSITGGLSALTLNHVATVSSSPADAASFAIASITDDNTLQLSGLHLGLSASESLTLSVRTFEPQVSLVHSEILASLGIDAHDPILPLSDSAVVSTELIGRIESLGTLWRIFEAGQGVSDRAEAFKAKAEEYRKRYIGALASARVLIDTDGDGVADCWRSPAVGQLTRA